MANFLKKLVATLGVLIVLALILMGYGFYKKSTDPAWRLFSSAAPRQTTGPTRQDQNIQDLPATINDFGSINLNLAPECRIDKTTLKKRILAVQTGPAGLCESIIIIDITAGKKLGTIRLR